MATGWDLKGPRPRPAAPPRPRPAAPPRPRPAAPPRPRPRTLNKNRDEDTDFRIFYHSWILISWQDYESFNHHTKLMNKPFNPTVL